MDSALGGVAGTATTITRWHNTHANLDPTNSPTQFELRGDAPFKAQWKLARWATCWHRAVEWLPNTSNMIPVWPRVARGSPARVARSA